jgi:hypothetical protein
VITLNETVIAALSALGTGILSLIGVYFANRKSTALIGYRLEQLEHKVDVHNRVVERVFKLEGEMVEAQHDIRDLKAK